MTNQPIQLTHKQRIVCKSFVYDKKIEIVTPRGYAIENGDCPDAAERRAKEFGHNMVSSVQHDAVLTGDYAGKAEDLAAEKKANDEAQVVAQNDVVEVEGKLYLITSVNERHADPIKFTPVSESKQDEWEYLKKMTHADEDGIDQGNYQTASGQFCSMIVVEDSINYLKEEQGISEEERRERIEALEMYWAALQDRLYWYIYPNMATEV